MQNVRAVFDRLMEMNAAKAVGEPVDVRVRLTGTSGAALGQTGPVLEIEGIPVVWQPDTVRDPAPTEF